MADWDKMTVSDLKRQRDMLVATIWRTVNEFYDETGFEVSVSGWFDEGSASHKVDVSVTYPSGKG